MKNRIVYGTLLITGTLLMSNAFAGLSQAHWLAQINHLSPSAVCKIYFSKPKFKKLLDAHQIDQGKCITLSRASLDTCVNQYKDKLP
ncbi:MAG: hypothetical protein IIC67_02920, partial [Thaumarchaeota archaeon]|nr:hypothetical protein [Nitrososphaerota archaeon]